MGYKTDWFKGVFPALVTPFDTHDQVDEAAYRELIRFVLPHVNGLVPCGTTGEFSYLSADERKRTIEICLDEVRASRKDIPVVAGTGAMSTRETVELTAWAGTPARPARWSWRPISSSPTLTKCTTISRP